MAALALAACSTPVGLPVEVGDRTLSPAYLLRFVNETGEVFEVLPSSAGAGQPAMPVPPGGRFDAILQVRRITVGAGSSTPAVQVVDGAYVDQAMADKAEVRFIQRGPRSLLIALDHPSWFGEPYEPGAAPVLLLVPVRAFSLAPLFPKGPSAGP